MGQLTEDGTALAAELSARWGFSTEAVVAMMSSVSAGGGGMAQFDHPEFGGMGQWSRGGMTMIGDMFNNALKARVDGLCADIAGTLNRQLFRPVSLPTGSQSQSQSQGGWPASGVSLSVSGFGGGWWPSDLGQPSSTGSQNNIRYAVFPSTRRLAIDIGGALTIYDTLDHSIGGVSQQQSGDASLTFTSQHGLVRVSELPVVHDRAVTAPAEAQRAPAAEKVAPAVPSPVAETPHSSAAPAQDQGSTPPPAPERSPQAIPSPPRDATFPPATESAPSGHGRSSSSPDDVFSMLERLAALREKGVLSDEEFLAKKTELLARL